MPRRGIPTRRPTQCTTLADGGRWGLDAGPGCRHLSHWGRRAEDMGLLCSGPAVRRHREASAFRVRVWSGADGSLRPGGRARGTDRRACGLHGPGTGGRPSADPAWMYHCVSRQVQHQWGPQTQRGAAGAQQLLVAVVCESRALRSGQASRRATPQGLVSTVKHGWPLNVGLNCTGSRPRVSSQSPCLLPNGSRGWLKLWTWDHRQDGHLGGALWTCSCSGGPPSRARILL